MIALEPALARLRHHVNDKSKLRAREHEVRTSLDDFYRYRFFPLEEDADDSFAFPPCQLVEVASRKLGTRKYAFTKKGYRLHLRSGDRIRLLEFADRWVNSLIDRKARLEAALGASAPAQGTAQDASKGSGVETQGAAVRLPSLLDESEAGSTSIAVNVPASVVESGQTFASRLETPSEECVVPSVEPAAEFGEELASPSPTEARTSPLTTFLVSGDLPHADGEYDPQLLATLPSPSQKMHTIAMSPRPRLCRRSKDRNPVRERPTLLYG